MVGAGHGGGEVVDTGLVGGERPGDVARSDQPALDGLAGGPVLTIGEVPEVHGVRRAEAFGLHDVLRAVEGLLDNGS